MTTSAVHDDYLPICPVCWHGLEDADWARWGIEKSDQFMCSRGHQVVPMYSVLMWCSQRPDGGYEDVEPAEWIQRDLILQRGGIYWE